MAEPATEQRETLGTTPTDAEPEEAIHLPSPTYWPLILALGLAIGFAGFLVHPLMVIAGAVVGLGAAILWIWPDRAGRHS